MGTLCSCILLQFDKFWIWQETDVQKVAMKNSWNHNLKRIYIWQVLRHLVPLCEDAETNGPSFVRLLFTAVVVELRCFKVWPSDGATCFSAIVWVMLASVLTDENAIWRWDFKSGINVMAVEVEVAEAVEAVFIAVFNGTSGPWSCLLTWSLLSEAPSFAIGGCGDREASGGDEGGGKGEAAVAPVVEWPHLNNWA